VRTSRWTQACPGWRGDLAAYLVGALDPQACSAVRRHLGTCPACEAEYQDLAPVVSWLAGVLEAGPRSGGGWIVRARFPLDAPTPPQPGSARAGRGALVATTPGP
jgi:anti-sigma factor RsiW